jgi:nucleotide-binding universal stress UspA family protein
MLGGTGETIVDIGDPGPAICEEAKVHGVDLIVIGRSGKNWLSRLLDPSVSEYVIKHAPCPVLVVRHETPVAGFTSE